MLCILGSLSLLLIVPVVRGDPDPFKVSNGPMLAAESYKPSSTAPAASLPPVICNCKTPLVSRRRLADDVFAASPFYVVALTRTPHTEQIDNCCYTYYPCLGGFVNILSTVYKNGKSSQAVLFKGDIPGQTGIANATGDNCNYLDYTLIPICGETIFVLYRCFISGYKSCSKIDVGPTPGVDVRVVLAANPNISNECVSEIKNAFKNTKGLDSSDFILLPQKRSYQCVTTYTRNCINAANALGSISLTQ